MSAMRPGGNGDGQPLPQETINDRRALRDALDLFKSREHMAYDAFRQTMTVVKASTPLIAALVDKMPAAGPPRTEAAVRVPAARAFD